MANTASFQLTRKAAASCAAADAPTVSGSLVAALQGKARAVAADESRAALCGDPATLRAAAAVEARLGRFVPAKRHAAWRYLSGYPAAGCDPRGQCGVLPRPVSGQRAVQVALTAAGDRDLADAAGRLAVWAGPLVRYSELRWELLDRMPDGIVSDLATEITRRLLCDAAGLVAVSALTVVSADAVTDFTPCGAGTGRRRRTDRRARVAADRSGQRMGRQFRRVGRSVRVRAGLRFVDGAAQPCRGSQGRADPSGIPRVCCGGR